MQNSIVDLLFGLHVANILQSCVFTALFHSGFDAKDSADKMFKNFGPNSPYDKSSSGKYSEADKHSKQLRDQSEYPIHQKWRGFILRRFTECHAKGVTVESLKEEDANLDPDNIPRNIPLVAMLAGKPELLSTLQESVLQTQTNDMMVAIVMAAARIIERYILNGSAEPPVHPVEQVMQDLRNPKRLCPDDLDLAMAKHLKDVLENKALSVQDASTKFGVN